MLYRTQQHHPFLFTFNPSFSHTPFSPLLFSSPSSPSPLQGMECVQGALVGGFGPEAVSKTAAFADDLLVVNGGPNAVSGDDLFVDELLDFSNDLSEDEDEEQPEKGDGQELEQKQDKNTFSSVSQETQTAPEESGLSPKPDFDSLPETELAVPAEGLESLEWLSHFVEDSFSDYSLTVKLPPATKRPGPATVAQEQACFTTPVQTKARTKRARTGVRVWPVLSPSFTESSTSSSSSSSTTSFSPPNTWTIQSHTGESFPPVKKQKKKKSADAAGGGGLPAQPRRCSHCGVTKTPQWRAGPLGSKTLCNACGVRFKSGRLLPEYRPACSPTFSTELHSNNHRKVLEMRRKKESEPEAPAAGLPPPVQSF